MLIKFLCTFGYLIGAAAAMYVGTRLWNLQIESVGKKPRLALGLGLTMALLALQFAQFWLLTGMFPTQVVLLLAGATVLATWLVRLMGAILGFDSAANREKLQALAIIKGVQEPALGCAAVTGVLLSLAVSIVGSLWEFWAYPLGDPHAKVWITAYHFLVPTAAGMLVTVAFAWRVLAAAETDVDMRNMQLVGLFFTLLRSCIILVFPVWLLQTEIPQVFGVLPSYGVVVSLPLLLFLVGGALPALMGVLRSQQQRKSMQQWQERWLRDTLEACRLPDGSLRDRWYEQQVQAIVDEIKNAGAANPLLQLYVQADEHGQVDEMPALPPPDEPPSAAIARPALMGASLRAQIDHARGVLRGRTRAPVEATDQQGRVAAIVQRYRPRLVEWDVRFEYFKKLLDLSEVAAEGHQKDVAPYLRARLKGVQSEGLRKTQRGALGAGLLGIATTVLGLLLKTFQEEISALIKHLVGV